MPKQNQYNISFIHSFSPSSFLPSSFQFLFPSFLSFLYPSSFPSFFLHTFLFPSFSVSFLHSLFLTFLFPSSLPSILLSFFPSFLLACFFPYLFLPSFLHSISPSVLPLFSYQSCLSVGLSISLPICLSAYMSVYLYFCLSISIYLSIHLRFSRISISVCSSMLWYYYADISTRQLHLTPKVEGSNPVLMPQWSFADNNNSIQKFFLLYPLITASSGLQTLSMATTS